MYQNKTVLIAGGSSGIGEALVKQFHRRGSLVYSFDLQSPQNKLKGIEYENVDVSNLSSVRAGLSTIQAPIDYLINSAGIREEETPEGIKKMFEVNMNGTFNLFRLSLLKLSLNARMVQISSDLAGSLPKDCLGYATSKLASYNIARQFAAMHQDLEVKIALPGPIDTPLFRKGKSAEKIKGIKPRSAEYLAGKIIELLESDKKELICMNDYGVWTHELR